MKKYYPSIQVLRGVLFIFILAFHCGIPCASFGWGGVEAFFVISTFFLVRKYWGKESISVKEQFKHRMTRLYPPYIIVLILAVFYALLKKNIPLDLLTHLLSSQNFHWMITDYQSAMQPMTAHTWTLSIEIWGGLLWLLLLKYLSKEQFKKTMYAFLLIGIIYRVVTIVYGANVWIVSLCPLSHFDAFSIGSLLAIGVEEKKVDWKIGILSVVGGVGIIACIIWLSYSNGVGIIEAYQLLSSSKNYLNSWFTGNIYLFISLLTSGIVGLLYLRDEKRNDEIGKVEQVFVKLGDNSYVLYLFHWPILAVLKRLTHHWGSLLFGTLVVSIVAAIIFNWLNSKINKKRLGGI